MSCLLHGGYGHWASCHHCTGMTIDETNEFVYRAFSSGPALRDEWPPRPDYVEEGFLCLAFRVAMRWLALAVEAEPQLWGLLL